MPTDFLIGADTGYLTNVFLRYILKNSHFGYFLKKK